jgi:hypothetical protein
MYTLKKGAHFCYIRRGTTLRRCRQLDCTHMNLPLLAVSHGVASSQVVSACCVIPRITCRNYDLDPSLTTTTADVHSATFKWTTVDDDSSETTAQQTLLYCTSTGSRYGGGIETLMNHIFNSTLGVPVASELPSTVLVLPPGTGWQPPTRTPAP